VVDAAFGMQLREHRKAAALSLRQLAVRVGYDHSYLSQVERGQRPGSADLARLCDRELGTGNQLASKYEQAQRRVVPAAQRAGSVHTTAQIGSIAAPTDTGPDTGIAALQPIDAAWHGLVGAFGGVEGADEWDALLADLEDWRSVPLARLLPELVAELQLLRAHASRQASTQAAVRATQLSVLIAVTLTGLGQLRGAERWWRAARVTADSSGELWARSLVRAREVASGLVQRRPLPELLQMADDAVDLSRRASSRPGCAAQAHATRAQVLAELGQAAEAHRALQELLSIADQLPLASTSTLGDWTAYEVHRAEGRVCARLGHGAAGCVLLGRALELCPAEWVGERAGVEMGLAECLVVDGEIAAGVALALRVLVELPDQWHSYYLYDAGERVLSVVREKEPGLPAARDLQELLRRRVYLGGRSAGSGSSYGVGRE
jgi:transcriptional regulator with XRE-family HTH domain